MAERWEFTDELKERTLMLASYGVPGDEIAKAVGCSARSTVNSLIRIAKLVEEDKLEDAKTASITGHCPSYFDWALKKYKKSLPVPETPPAVPDVTADIKKAVADAIAENCKVAKIEQIDKDQMARIMLALGKITDALADICLRLEDFQKTSNANADSMYALITSMHNSIMLELKKRK